MPKGYKLPKKVKPKEKKKAGRRKKKK